MPGGFLSTGGRERKEHVLKAISTSPLVLWKGPKVTARQAEPDKHGWGSHLAFLC